MTTNVVTDEDLGVFFRRVMELGTRLRKGKLQVSVVLAGLQCLIEGTFDATSINPRRLINEDVLPYMLEDWRLAEHRFNNIFYFNPYKISFKLGRTCQWDKPISGHQLREELSGKPGVMNARVLDHLIANPRLIPDSWKSNEGGDTYHIFFLGTIYTDPEEKLWGRYLYFNEGQWCSGYRCLDDEWGYRHIAIAMRH